jgi:hypothetical protein
VAAAGFKDEVREMSGPAPETERERQLRAFANRLLSWPDPEGPSTVELMPVGYPVELPPELVDYSDLRFLGSVVRRRAGELLSIQLLFEMAGDANDLLERYERSLLDLGWQNVNQPGLHRGGFSGGDTPKTSVLVNVEKKIRVYLQSTDEGDGSLLHVYYHPPTKDELPDDLSPEAPPGRSPLPSLKPPPGVRITSSSSGGGGSGWSNDAVAQTEMTPMELEAYFAKQLEGAGWGRVVGSADEFFAWSSWLVPDVQPAPELRGVLIVLADSPGRRSLSLRAESAPRR